MSLFILVLGIELALSLTSYFVLHKLNLVRSVVFLTIISSSVGLVGGWVTGYRATGAYLLSSYWDQTNIQLQERRGSKMSNEESKQLYDKIMANPEFYRLCHKNAATHSLPAFLIVFLIIFSIARKRKINQ